LIRARDRVKTSPIMAMTVRTVADDRETSMQVGASDHATTPVDIDQIISMMRAWLR